MLPNRRDEVDLFKSLINLSEYAASQGYLLDRQHSSRNSVAMRGPTGDKIMIARDARDARDGNWIYFSIDDDQDNGTILDFVRHRQHLNLGQVRKVLRPWVGLASDPPKRPPAVAFQQHVEPIGKDLAAILAQFAAMTPILHGHPYLEDERRIPRAVLDSARFAGRLYTDRYHNAVFPHHNRTGVCGFELRNFTFKGFSKGGQKGVWYSTARPGDTTLIICESAIDALSYHALHRPERARYFSIAGEMNPLQKEFLASGMHKLPEGGRVIIATDQDAGGTKLASSLRAIAQATGREDLAVIDHRPERAGDWNDVVRAITTPETSRREPAPAHAVDNGAQRAHRLLHHLPS